MKTQTIVFGGGCFWCIEAVFMRLIGVTHVESGYAGGASPDPSYEQVSSGKSGHVEVVKVEFDPDIIKLEDLLNVFFSSHDPTSWDRQGDDAGPQYRSVIFYTSQQQKQAVEKYIREYIHKLFDKPLVTELRALENFFAAEDYHQQYYDNNSTKPYCRLVIDPKLQKLQEKYSHLLKQ